MNKIKSFKGSDHTLYAQTLGYSGSAPVIVLDGKVISHRNKDWFLFCESLRQKNVSK